MWHKSAVKVSTQGGHSCNLYLRSLRTSRGEDTARSGRALPEASTTQPRPWLILDDTNRQVSMRQRSARRLTAHLCSQHTRRDNTTKVLEQALMWPSRTTSSKLSMPSRSHHAGPQIVESDPAAGVNTADQPRDVDKTVGNDSRAGEEDARWWRCGSESRGAGGTWPSSCGWRTGAFLRYRPLLDLCDRATASVCAYRLGIARARHLCHS